MNGAFIQLLTQYGSLSSEDIAKLSSHLRPLDLKKDQFLLQPGEVCTQIGFILEGVIRIFYCDKDGNEFTRYLLKENHFAVNLYSFNDETPSSEYLHALTDCKLIMISKQAMEKLYKEIPEWTSLIKKITERALLDKVAVKNNMLAEDAKARYQRFAQEHPDLLLRVPLGYIASYLGITQSSLSRIRKNASREVLFAK